MIYDFDVVADRIAAALRWQGRVKCQFLFAVKAFPDFRGLGMFMRSGIGFDVSNNRELELVGQVADACQVNPSFVSVTGPLADISGLDPACGVINLEGRWQLEHLAGWTGPVGARVSLAAEKIDGRAHLSLFGMEIGSEGLETVLADPRFAGMHHHDARPMHLHERLTVCQAMVNAAASKGSRLDYVNLGGRLEYFDDAEIEDFLDRASAIVGPQPLLLLEPGSFWFRGAGFALGRVLGIDTTSSGISQVFTDLSKDCHLKWSTPQLLFSSGLPNGPIILRGSTCHAGDVVGVFESPGSDDLQSELPDGFLVLANIDGYSAAWNHEFNGIRRAEVILHGID